MWKEIIFFELRYRLGRPLFYAFTIAFLFFAIQGTVSSAVEIGGSVGQVARNAPYVVTRFLIIFSLMATILLTAFVASAVNRDHEIAMQQMIFATPVRKAPYLMGRFIGSLIPVVLTICVAAVGMIVAAMLPIVDASRMVPFSPWPYLSAILVFVLPNLLFVGALMFSAATLSRRMIWSYVALIAFLNLWGVTFTYSKSLGQDLLAALLDTTGLSTYLVITKYWTIAEKNSMSIPLTTTLVLNRLLWTTLSAVILFLTHYFYRMRIVDSGARAKAQPEALLMDSATHLTASAGLQATPPSSTAARLFAMSFFDMKQVMKSLPFFVILLFGALNLIANMQIETQGTVNYPVTRRMLLEITGGYDLFLMIVIVLYSGWIVFRDRDTRVHEITGIMPVSDWVPVVSNMVSMGMIVVTALGLAMGITIVRQLLSGAVSIELSLYARDLFLRSFSYWMLVAALSVFCHSVLNNRYLGYAAVVGVLLSVETVLPKLGVHHHLLLYGTAPRVIYTDMNGYGHLAAPLFWFHLYWWSVAGLLLVAATLLRVRGTNDRFSQPLTDLRRRFARGTAVATAAFALLFLLCGSWIFYNTNILNVYRTPENQDRMKAEYEMKYLQYRKTAKPTLTAVSLRIDLAPEDRRAHIVSRMTLRNNTERPLSEIHVSWDPELVLNGIELASAGSVILDDPRLGYRIYRLRAPLQPGETRDMKADLTFHARGFVNDDANRHFVANGTFFTNEEYMPVLGYNPFREVSDPMKRKRAGLPEKPPEPSNLDPRNARFPLLNNGGRIDFEAVVSTSPDQIVITPGYLVREWMENGRRFFHYRMDKPIWNFYSVQSARFTVKRSDWHGIRIEVFYHPGHAFNVERMIEAVQRTLEYCSREFGPYPDRQIRIVEFPGFSDYAQSFPNTIPFSETAGFTEDIRNPEHIDTVFWLTSHEVAHQFTLPRIEPAYAEGANMIVESVTQYAAYMSMEQTYGPERMSKFLRYELDRYLKGRGNERKEENPLIRVNTTQPYIYYSKGGLAFLALREAFGEEALNRALRAFFNDPRWNRFTGVYPLSTDLFETLRTEMPEKYHGLLRDLFQEIILYDLKVTDASAVRNPDGTWLLTVKVQARKIRADGQGRETEIPNNDEIEIGVYAKDPYRPLLRELRTIESNRLRLTCNLKERPLRVEIDPRHLLLDRVPEDNVRTVTVSS